MSIAEKLATIAENEQKVFDMGRAVGQGEEMSRFWDAYQNEGNPKSYRDAFRGTSWTDVTYTPLYAIETTTSAYSAYCTFMDSQITDTKCPITVNCTVAQSMFSGCTALQRIAYLELNGVTDLSSAFLKCSALRDVTFGGSIDVNVKFDDSDKLMDTSVQSIIDHLKDLTGATGKKLTLHATVGAKLTDAQKAAITAKNWTLVY